MAATWTLLASNFASAAATTITVTATLTAGRALHIGVISDDATVSSVADTLSNGYTEQGSVIEAAILRRLHNITSVPSTGGSTTITATFAASVANRQIVVYEGTGTSTYDAQGTQTDTGNNPTGNVTATNSAQPASVHAVSFFYQGGTPTVGTGYSDSGLAFSGSGMLLARGEYKSVSSIGSQSANFGNATLDRQCSIMAIFLEPAPPAFTVQPVQQTAASGGTAVFATTVTGATSYQWQEQVSGAWASVATGSGGTTDTYTTATLSSTDNGRRLRLLATNAAGTTGSAEVFLFLTGQPITGKGRQGRGSAWWQRSIAEAGAGSGLKAALLRKSPMRGPNFDDADFIAAWNNWYFPAAAGGGGTAVGLATEADTAFALAGLQIRALGLSTETDTALALTVTVARATGLASETDTAFALARVQIRAAGLALETDTALALGGVAIRALGLASEADTAFALAAVQVRATGRADEADTAFAAAGVQLRAVGRADETDTAFALTPGAGGTAAGMATETDSAFALAGLQIRATGRADETDTALALAAVSVRAVGLASESDTAFARAAVQSLLVGLALETDTAFALAGAAGNIRYVIGDGAVNNGNGLFPNAAASPGADGAYTVPPGNSFASNLEWRMIAGTTLDMGATGLTTGNNATIVKFGSGANPIIRGTNSTILNSSTAAGVSISDISIIRTGGVSGTGYNASQTSGTNLQRVTITGSQTNLSPNDATSLTVNGCTFGAASTEYGLRTTQATVDCSDWAITNNTFGGGIGIELQASSAANAAGRYTGLTITGNTFPASASSAIIMQSVMNLTGSAHTLEVLNTTQIRIAGGTWPAWNVGQVIFLTGFNNVANFAERTVVSIIGDTLTVSGAALAVEAAGVNKGAGLIDPARMFVAPEIAYNTCTGQQESPMLLASIYGGRIHHNTVSGQVGSGTKTAAAIELIYASNGLIVDYNTIGPTTGYQDVDNAGIFTDGGCDGVIVRNNTISNVIPGGQDNSGQGSAMFYTRNCIHELNTYMNCYRGTWAGGAAGGGNIIRNNIYTSCDIGIDINCSPAVGAFDYLTGHTFSNNRIDVFSCPDGLTIEGAPSSTGRDGAGGVPMRKWRYYGDEQPEAPAPVAAPAPIPQAVAAPAPAALVTVSLTAMLSRMAEQRAQIRADIETQQRLEQESLQIATQAIERAALALAIEEQAIEDDDEEAIGMALQMLL